MRKYIYITLSAFLLVLASSTTAQAQSGQIDWNGWSFDYEVSDFYDGVSLKDVTFNGTKILEKASFPVMRVFYEGDACGPYADRLGGTLEPVSWADDALVVTREIELDGEKWFEVGIEDFIGNYDLYQVWYLSENGVIDAHTFARGLQCSVDHEHLPYWRLDFDLAGAENDQILQETANGWEVMTSEFDQPANTALNHGWQVRDEVTGDAVFILFDDGVGNVPGEVIPETEFVNNNVFGRKYSSTEDEGWIYGPLAEVPFNDGENIDGEDLIFWYSGFLPHGWAEGAELWHSTGLRLFVNPTILVLNPGSQVNGLGETVSLSLGMGDATFTATGLPAGVSIDAATGVISGTLTTVGTSVVTVTATSDGESEQVTFTWEVSPAMACEVIASTDVFKSIGPDEGDVTTSTLTISDLGEVMDIDVLDLAGTHTYMGDLDFQLVSPAGTSVEIMSRECGSDNDFGLSLDDEVSAYRPCPPVGGGTYIPDNPLDVFLGENASGTWQLLITDNANSDSGELTSWSLNVCAAVEAVSIESPGNQANLEGDIVNLQVTAVNPAGAPLAFDASGLPGGLSIDDAGLISGTINGSTAGTFDVTVTVDDGAATASTAFTWTVTVPAVARGEVGVVNLGQASAADWHTVTLDNTYDSPVVIIGAPSINDDAPVTVRVKNVTASSFEYQLDEWDYLDNVHAAETVAYMVVEAGTHTLDDGRVIQAGQTSATDSWQTMGLADDFDAAPVVFSQVGSVNEGAAVTTRQRNVTDAAFELQLEEEELGDGVHASETVYWVAIEAGDTAEGLSHEAGKTGDAVDEVFDTINFAQAYAAAPLFFAAMQSADGGDPATVRHKNLGANSVEVFVEEEQSSNDEVGHTNETVGYVAFGSAGLIWPGDVEPVTLALGDLNLGIAAHDDRTGTGYIMYSAESVHTRLSATPPSGGNADHLIAVVFEGGQWKVDRNKTALVAFTPQASDILVAEVDFGANTVDHLEGTESVIEGMMAGYDSGDLVVTAEMWGGAPNGGEFGVTGTEITVMGASGNSSPVLATIGNQTSSVEDAVSLTLSATDSDGDAVSFDASGLPSGLSLDGNEISGSPASAGTYNVSVTVTDGNGGSDSESFTWTINGGTPGSTVTLALGDVNLGIAAHDSRTGPGYIMFSEESVHTRFAANPPSGGNADHLIAVVFEDGQWKVDRNKRVLIAFTPATTDLLVAEVDFGADTVTHLLGTNKVIEGMAAGYVSGDLIVTAEMWAGSPNSGEFGIEGTLIEIAAEVTGGERRRDELVSVQDVPDEFALASIYPNPFGTSTTVEYHLPEESTVRVDVYNIMGQRVNVLVDDRTMPAGYWSSVWDGSNENGQGLAAGVYIIRFEANGFIKTGKVILVK